MKVAINMDMVTVGNFAVTGISGVSRSRRMTEGGNKTGGTAAIVRMSGRRGKSPRRGVQAQTTCILGIKCLFSSIPSRPLPKRRSCNVVVGAGKGRQIRGALEAPLESK